MLTSNRNRTMFIDFPLELLLNIFEYLDVNSLTAIAKTHPYNCRATEIAFKSKYNTKTFEINGNRLNAGQIMTDSNYPIEFHSALHALELFGHLIKRLTVDYHFLSEKQSEMINTHLSKYVAKSLIEFELIHCHDQNLYGLAVDAFHSVTNVSFRDGHISSMITIDLSELFPSIEILDLRTMWFVSTISSERHFRHLKELTVETSLVTDSGKLERRLRLNQQLQKLSLYGGNWRGLEMISRTLNNLEHLIYRGFYCERYRGEEIHFVNMKSFEVSLSQVFPDLMESVPIRFGNLEEIVCDGKIDLWMEVIVNNKKLKKITAGRFNDQQLQRIIDELNELEEFTLEFETDSNDIATIVRCIEQSKCLTRFRLYRCNSSIRNEIANRLSDWRIASEDGLFVFVRQSDVGEF